jgi:hypothetical protein
MDEDDNMDGDENLDHNDAMAEAHQLRAPVDDALKIANTLELENALKLANAFKTDDALDILLHNATEEFGFAPCDVYTRHFTVPRGRRVFLRTCGEKRPLDNQLQIQSDRGESSGNDGVGNA